MKQLFRVAVAAGLLAIALPAPASAAGATVSFGPASADPDYATVLQVKGAGFQSVPKGHGGIYLLFGWVADGAWPPSQGGAAGTTYRYVQDKETKDNNGFQRFVAFPGSDTTSAANGGEIAADGTWSTKLVIPGARFKAADRAGKIVDIDCLKVRCGLITVGAHGVVNANNETFTPVTFAVPKPATQAAAPPPPSSVPPPSSSAAPVSSSAPPPSLVDSPPPAVASAPAVQPAAQSEESGSWWWIAVLAGAVLIAALAIPLIRSRRRARNAEGE